MKKAILALTVLALTATPALAIQTFTMNQNALLMLGDLAHEGPSYLSTPTTDPVVYNGTGGMKGVVGFSGLLDDVTGDSWAQITIGAAGTTATDLIESVTGVADSSLLGYGRYTLGFYNDNDDISLVQMYVQTGSEIRTSAWVALAPGSNAKASVDLVGMADLDEVTEIGFIIGANLTNVGGNPSDPDVFHVSVTPVPAPGAIVLGSLGIGLVGWLRRRTLV